MSPYPVQTNRETIIETARMLLERDGVENLALGNVASELGIKAPSLYRHIESKGALLHEVIENTYQHLFQAYDQALENAGEDPAEQLLDLAQAQRAFAHANSNTYMLAYAVQNPELRADPNMLLERAISVQKIMVKISGEENSLPALRGLLALIHGYIMLELNGQFQRGGDLSLTFEEIVSAYLQGWQ
jgi:AcrR family transcriptional regulator